MTTFKVGDSVTWSSQAGGRTVTKTGEVIEVVPALERPKTQIKGMGFHRDHESYIVRASKTTDRKRTALYWPVVKNLRKAYERFNEQALRDEIVRVWGEHGAHVEVYDMLLRKLAELKPLLQQATEARQHNGFDFDEWHQKAVAALTNPFPPPGDPQS